MRQFGTKSHFEKGPLELMIYKQKQEASPAESSGHLEKYGCYEPERAEPDQHNALYGHGTEKEGVNFYVRMARRY